MSLSLLLTKRSTPSFCFLPVGHKYTNVPWAKAVYVPRAIKRLFFYLEPTVLGKKTTLYCPRDINAVFARGTLYINIRYKSGMLGPEFLKYVATQHVTRTPASVSIYG